MEKQDHKEIYLEPLFSPQVDGEIEWYDSDGRSWCQDNVWCAVDYDGVEATRYVRADIFEQLEKENAELKKRKSALKNKLQVIRDSLASWELSPEGREELKAIDDLLTNKG